MSVILIDTGKENRYFISFEDRISMKSIRSIILTFCIALIAVVSLGVFISLKSGLGKIQRYSMESVRTERMKGYDDSVKFQIQNVASLLNSFYAKEQAGTMTRRQAQDEAIRLIKSLRYGDDSSGYFWIDDTDCVLVAHPILPQDEGKNRSSMTDKNGVKIIHEIMKVAENGGGFSEFYFTKSDGVTVAPKRTYSMLFRPWNWIISSGNYYDDIDAELNVVEEGEKNTFSSLYKYMTLNLMVMMFASAFAAAVFARWFAKPIDETAVILSKMSKGNLSLRLPPSGNRTELGTMRENVNAFAASMNNMVLTSKNNINSLNRVAEELNRSSEDISSEIKQISENSTELAGHAKRQQNTVNETVTTMDRMNSLVEKLSSQISEQNEALSQSSAATEQMISNINSITENIDKFGNSFKKLAAGSESGKNTIENVIHLVDNVSEESAKLLDTNKIIESVAEQTNLLAMNAAIEAAHAGEAGKGFAVVAEEIRKLSESTTEQSHAIMQTLSGVIENIADVTNAANNAGQMFGEIVRQISDDDALISEIRSSMEEQTVGSKQIVDALSNIKDTTHIIIDSSKQMKDGIETVVSHVGELESLSDRLKDGTEGIEKSASVINGNTDSLIKMAAQNRQLAERLSSETEKYTV